MLHLYLIKSLNSFYREIEKNGLAILIEFLTNKNQIMVKNINAAIIGCNMSEEFFRSTETNKVENFSWKKIFLSDGPSSTHHKQFSAEIVDHPQAILNDADIELVFISADHLQFVKPVIDSGKSVRVV